MRASLSNSLFYLPRRAIDQTPAAVGLTYEDVEVITEDGERLHGWWIPAIGASEGHILYLHGSGGNIADRLLPASLLAHAGFDVFLVDYRGYGRSSGSPYEEGTYRDARAARASLLRRSGADTARLIYLGESLGGAVALALALEAPPRGLVLQSTFTRIRDLGRILYPFIPPLLLPDTYNNLRRVPGITAPVLFLHGNRDDIVPLSQGEALFRAVRGPKQFQIVAGAGHNNLVLRAGAEYASVIATWFRRIIDDSA